MAAVNELIKGAVQCEKPRPHLAYIAPFRDQAKRVAWDYLKHYSRPLWDGGPNESELSVRLLGNRRISLFGADNADALRGIYLDGVVPDEFGDFKPGVWGNVIRPALSDRAGWAAFGGTPKGRNEFWQIREIARKNPDEWFLLELRADESGILNNEELEEAQKQLTPEQFAQEYLCDFAAALPGAYFGRELVTAERDGRITDVPYDDAVPVYTAWDIGRHDDTAIWWYQVVSGEIHVIDFWAASGHDPASASEQLLGRRVSIDIVGDSLHVDLGEFLPELAHRTKYRYGTHWLPHDARAKTFAAKGKSTVEQLATVLGKDHIGIVPSLSLQDGIQAARMAIKRAWFDEEHCDGDGLEALRQYQREYDEDKKAFREKPRHDWTSHPADAFRMLAVAWREEEKQQPKPEDRILSVGPHSTATMDDLWKAHDRQMRRSARI